MNKMNYNIAAIIITYNPDSNILELLLSLLNKKISNILVVDNGNSNNISNQLKSFYHNVSFLIMSENMGIAYAQNLGIDWASNKGVDYLLFLDQDSMPKIDMISILFNQISSMRKNQNNIAAIGPRFIDPRFNSTHSSNNKFEVKKVDVLISSGSLIPMDAIKIVGGMTEDLFIDYVDLDWCLRAKSLGLFCYQSQNAVMLHSLGDNPIELLGKFWPSREPIRHYYMCRNALWMYRNSNATILWKIVDFFKLLRKFIFYSILTKNRIKHFTMMVIGIWHGIIGKAGKYKF